MKTNLLLIILLSTLLFSSCSDNKKNKPVNTIENHPEVYRIAGTLKNVTDSTWVYINKGQKKIDSTQTINERFEFNGSVDEPSSFFMQVGEERRPEFFIVWVENKEINVLAEKGNIRNPTITGSQSQQEYDILKQRTDSLESVFDHVIKQLQKPETEKMLKEERNNLIQQQNDILEAIAKTNQTFVLDFPNSYVSASSLNGYTSNWGREKVKELYTPLSNRIKKSKYGQSIEHFLSLPEVPKVGEKFIDFKLAGIDGNPIKLSDNNKKYTLIEFWSSWCYPCRKENPNLIKTYNKYKDQGFEIIGVSIDQKEKDWLKAIKDDQLPWKQGVDLKGFKSDIALTYGVNGIPDNFIIDKNGIIIAKTLRGNALERKLKELFSNTTNNQ